MPYDLTAEGATALIFFAIAAYAIAALVIALTHIDNPNGDDAVGAVCEGVLWPVFALFRAVRKIQKIWDD